jgi:hypothetical protein
MVVDGWNLRYPNDEANAWGEWAWNILLEADAVEKLCVLNIWSKYVGVSQIMSIVIYACIWRGDLSVFDLPNAKECARVHQGSETTSPKNSGDAGSSRARYQRTFGETV